MEWKNTHEIGRFVAEASNESRERIVWKSEIGRGIINLDSKVGKFIGTILIPALPNERIRPLLFFYIYSSSITVRYCFQWNRIKQAY